MGIKAKYREHIPESDLHLLEEEEGEEAEVRTIRMVAGGVVKVEYEFGFREYYYRGNRISYGESNTYNPYRYSGRRYPRLSEIKSVIDKELDS